MKRVVAVVWLGWLSSIALAMLGCKSRTNAISAAKDQAERPAYFLVFPVTGPIPMEYGELDDGELGLLRITSSMPFPKDLVPDFGQMEVDKPAEFKELRKRLEEKNVRVQTMALGVPGRELAIALDAFEGEQRKAFESFMGKPAPALMKDFSNRSGVATYTIANEGESQFLKGLLAYVNDKLFHKGESPVNKKILDDSAAAVFKKWNVIVDNFRGGHKTTLGGGACVLDCGATITNHPCKVIEEDKVVDCTQASYGQLFAFDPKCGFEVKFYRGRTCP